MVINIKSETDLSGFYIVYKGSTMNEKPGWRGISHLMEHLVYKSIDYLMNDFDRFGIGNNAYTSGTEIVFYLTGLDEFVSGFREEVLEKLLKFQITEEQFENERKIVLEEYMDVFNNQANSHSLNLSRKMYDDYDAIGAREDLEKMTYQDIKNYFELQYAKPHKIINVSKHNQFETDIKFSNIKFDNIIEVGDYNPVYEKFNVNPDKASVINVSPVITDDFPYIKFITKMLGGGLMSPLYQEIREKKGLVYYIHCFLNRVTDKSGVIQISSETSTSNVDEFQAIVKEVLSNPNKHMTQERFDIVKEAIIISLKISKINRHSTINKYITPVEWQIEPILEDLTLEKVMTYYDKYFNYDKYYLSVDIQENFNQ